MFDYSLSHSRGVLASGASTGLTLTPPDRRDVDSRMRLTRRIRAEFAEMAGLRLTTGQSARLFGISETVAVRVLAALVRDGLLWRGPDGRYGVRPSH
jgi:hypothetical protein